MNTESLIKNIHKFKSDIEGLNSSLETIETERYKQSKYQGAVTFIDDDGRSEAWTLLKPIFDKYSVPCCTAISSGLVGNNNYMTKEQITTLYNQGWEICNHTKTHVNLGNISDEEAIFELEHCNNFIIENKWGDGKALVLPYGGYSENTIRVVRKMFNSCFSIIQELNDEIIDQFLIKRVSTTDDYGNTGHTLEELKTLVDDAFNQGRWLVLTMHSWYNSFDSVMIDEIIKYIKSKNMPIVTASNGVEMFGNAIDTGSSRGINARVSQTGLTTGWNNILTNRYKNTNSSIYNFPKNTVSEQFIESNHITEFNLTTPTNTAGFLITHRHPNNDWGNYQEFIGYFDLSRHIRRWDETNKRWGSWLHASNLRLLYTKTDVNINSPLTSFMDNSVTEQFISNSDITNGITTPSGNPGFVTTKRYTSIGDGSSNYQEFTDYYTMKKYRRRWSTSQKSWTNWNTPFGRKTISVSDLSGGATIPPKTSNSWEVTVSGAKYATPVIYNPKFIQDGIIVQCHCSGTDKVKIIAYNSKEANYINFNTDGYITLFEE